MSPINNNPKKLFVPKKPQTGFFEFVAKNRGTMGGENKDKLIVLSEKWNNMTDVEKEEYNAIYKKNMIEYNKQIEFLQSTEEGQALLNEKEKEKKEKRANKKVKKGGKVDKKDKKARKVTPYNLFVKANFNEAKETIEGAAGNEGKASVGEVVKVVAEKWNSITDEKKNEWVRKAEEINKEKENSEVE